MGNTRLRCNFCDSEFEINHRMDEYPGETIRCPRCDTHMSTILFEFVEYVPDEDEESDRYAQSTMH